MSAEQASSSSSSSLSVSRLLSTIRGAKSRLQNERPRTTPSPVHPPPPAISHNLPAPEDITSRLASDLGLEFRVARKVSQIYVDKAVELQFLSQKRMGSTHKKIIRTARNSKAVADVNQLQNMLRDSQKRFYKRDIRSLLKQTTEMAKACYPNTRATEPDDTEDEDATSPTMKTRGDSADGSDDEGADGESGGGPANAEDEKALQDMSVLSSCILTGMYEKGHTFPRRHEKIKLAEATGLTYRQIGIWYSNRRERNRPGRKGGLAPSSSFTDSVSAATRESTVEISTSGRETAEATSPVAQKHFGYNQLNFSNDNGFAPSSTEAQELQQDIDDDMVATEVEDELDSPAGQDGSLDGSRVTSLSTSVSNLESMFVSAVDSQSSVDSYSNPWASMFTSSFVDLPAESPATAPTFDFSLPTETPTEPSCSTATMSIDFHDLSFLQQPASTVNAQSAEFLAGFMAGQAASSNAQFLTHTMSGPSQPVWQGAPQASVGDYQPGPSTQPSGNYPTSSPYLPYPPKNQDAGDVRPSKRPRVGGDNTGPSPARSAGSSKSRNSGLQQRRMAIAGQSINSSRNATHSSAVPRGPAPIAIAPRPAPTSQGIAPHPNNTNRGVKRAASSRDLAQTSSATVNPMLLNNTSLRNIKPMPQQSTRRLQPSHPGLVLPLAQPAIAMQ